MQYRNDIHGEAISQLGYGCMRFTTKGRSIDLDKAEKELMTAFIITIRLISILAVRRRSERFWSGTGSAKKSISRQSCRSI